jgi:hypothetical protein
VLQLLVSGASIVGRLLSPFCVYINVYLCEVVSVCVYCRAGWGLLGSAEVYSASIWPCARVASLPASYPSPSPSLLLRGLAILASSSLRQPVLASTTLWLDATPTLADAL